MVVLIIMTLVANRLFVPGDFSPNFKVRKSKMLAEGESMNEETMKKLEYVVDGVASVKADIIGFNITFPTGESKWSPDLPTNFICGNKWVNDPIPLYTANIDPVQSVIRVFLGIALFAVITGAWPLIASISIVVEKIFKTQQKQEEILHEIADAVNKENQDDDDEESSSKDTKEILNGKDKKKILNGKCLSSLQIVGRIWLLIASLAGIYFCVIISDKMLEITTGSSLMKVTPIEKCYRIEYANQNRASRSLLLSDNISTSNDTIESSFIPSTINKNTVQFITNCGQSFYDTQTGVKWTVTPATEVVCSRVNQTVLEKFGSFWKSWCPGGSNERAGKLEDQTGEIVFESKQPCAWLDPCFAGYQWSQRRLSYKTSNDQSWEKCMALEAKPRLYREFNGTIEEIHDGMNDRVRINNYFEVNLQKAREYGWYTNGKDEVIITADFNKGFGTTMIFESNENEIDDSLRRLAHDSWEGVTLDVKEILVAPSNPQCRAIIEIEGADTWQEFAQPCKSNVIVEGTENRYKFSTTEEGWCTVPLVTLDNENYSISINKRNPVVIPPVKGWRCETIDNVGTDCSESVEMNEFNISELVEIRDSVRVVEQRGQNSASSSSLGAFGDTMSDFAKKMFQDSLSDRLKWWEILLIVVGSVAGIVLICVVGVAISKCVKKKKTLINIMKAETNENSV